MSTKWNEIGSLQITDSVKLVASVMVSSNRIALDIREHISTANYTGPTKKGLNIAQEKVDDFEDFIINAVAEFRKKYH